MDEAAQLGLLLAGAFVATVAVVTAVPRSWLWRTIVLWVLGPAIVFFLGLFVTALASPGTAKPFENALFAFILLGSFSVIPWAAVSAVGVVAGLLARRAMRGREARAEAPPAARPERVPFAVRFSAWRSALLILLVAVVAIAGGTLWSLHSGPRSPQVLTPMPSGVPR